YKNIFSPMAFLCFLVSAILIFVNNQSLQIFLSRDLFRSLSPRILESTSQMGKGDAKAFDPALMESVLSIVQGYYVDSDRVTLDKLLEGALRGLSLSVQNTYYTDEGSSFELSLNGKKIELAKSSGEDSNAFLLTVRQLCRFLDDNNIADHLTGSARAIVGTEKQASTIILNAILSSLDAHSNLMSPESYRELRQGTDGEFGGLGIIVGVRDNILTVLKPIPRSPASMAGVMKGDRIIAINQQSTFGLNLDQLITHMRGEPGTPAQLTILREGLFSPIEVVVNRAVIEVDSVESFPYHDGNLHYLRLVIDSFASRTADEVESSIKEFKRRYPLNGLILDLRSNPGGLLDQAVAVSDLFLKSGVIVSTHGRRNETERVSKRQQKFLDFPITVLMDENSASASEIVAGALQDNGRALVVGQPSYGKGSVQTLFELHGERALKLTIARYLTPNHRSIQNKGIMPDIWIQPVTKSSSNSGMFGLSRFKSEAFLPNHLLSNFDNSSKMESSFNISGYYLKSENSSDFESDVELKIADLVFSKTKKIYGDRLPEGSQRSSHLIALSQPEVESFIKVKSKEIENWLFKQQNITWSGAIDSRRKSALQFQIDKLRLVSKVGSNLEIPWTLKNSNANAVENISVFMHAPYVGLESEELLVEFTGF
ncbi:MAG: S41 family peptidase, partial [Proteobacteria bacterium]|nr:S41 family peptidase [Pseudomonadota bacterium]